MEKLTQEELQSIKDLQTRYNQTVFELGSIEVQIATYEKFIVSLKEEKLNLIKDINLIEEKEKEITNVLVERYGSGTIDPNTGEVIPN
jgi:chromosome segregation ATPase